MTIQKIAVIGSGVMGSGIAAHIANAGLPVLLFDIEAPVKVIETMRDKGASGPLMLPDRADLIEACSLSHDLARLGEVDWICEVIVENLAVKQDLYAKIEHHRRAHAVISSNTSTIPLAQLVEGRSNAFAEHFLITHFFNPPRQMRLLELVTGAQTLPAVTRLMTDFCQNILGKGVVPCFDSPGFIANRIGTYWMMLALHTAIEQNIDIDAADTALAKIYGIPKTGVFGLMDLIGLDLMPKMVHSLTGNLPQTDVLHAVAATPPLMQAMINEGFTGRKGKGGFTRMVKDANGKTKYSLSLDKAFDPEQSYKPSVKTEPAASFAKEVMDKTLAYAQSLLGEVSNDKAAIDAAMVWGYGWTKGPFALMGESIELPHSEGAIFVRDCLGLLAENDHAALHDMGDGIGLIAFKTKMNVFDTGVFEILDKALALDLKGLVVGTDADHFSAGANVNRFLELAEAEEWHKLEAFVKQGQRVMQNMRHARMPVVAAINGYVMGGACELALHASAIVAHAETNIGLVEPRVGVIPAWGGCMEALRRLGAVEALKTILAQWQSASALDAVEKGYLAKTDSIVMNRDLLLARAKETALSLSNSQPRVFKAASVAERMEMEEWLNESAYDDHDKEIGQYLLEALCAPNEMSVWQAECDGFMALMRTARTQDKIRKILGR